MDNFWKFKKSTEDDAYKINWDDSDYVTVKVPHDYAIEGPFAEENDRQDGEKIDADGINVEITHTGRTGGLPITDWAWYRKEFFVGKDTKKVFIEFDGIMFNSSVYVNEKKVGGHIYGYTSFSIDITKECKFGEMNLMAVAVRPEGTFSRWYTGAGIYRNVRLVEKTADVYFPYQSIYVRPEVRGNRAEIDFDIDLELSDAQEYILEVDILDFQNKLVAKQKFIVDKKCGHQMIVDEKCGHQMIVDKKCGQQMIVDKKCGQQMIVDEKYGHQMIVDKKCGHQMIADEKCGHQMIADKKCGRQKFSGQIVMDNYRLWNVLDAYLYTCATRCDMKSIA
ncbi:hypothetical protein AN643_01770 [Candidatus Epulonipiscioides saccharophilum]|nr:hypothetical protein AN643_01770 [Epulopiscium sp. SCG-B10WGA-EpuloB]